MNFQQLQYIVAVDQYRHFLKASEACCVTQATLSMMVKKLEEELGSTIFDRSKKPVIPTETGLLILQKARDVLAAVHDLEQAASTVGAAVEGELRIGIIPTLAPYLLHLFLPGLLKKYPGLKITLNEWNTVQIVEALRHNQLDVGILATPIHVDGIHEQPVFYEKFLVFVSEAEKKFNHQYILPGDIDGNRLWLLEEEHCLRSQIMDLCSLRRITHETSRLNFEAGSIESLLNIVDINEGITIIPELTAHALSPKRKKQLRHFKEPAPLREISLVTYRHFVKKKLLTALADEIKLSVLKITSKKQPNQKVINAM